MGRVQMNDTSFRQLLLPVIGGKINQDPKYNSRLLYQLWNPLRKYTWIYVSLERGRSSRTQERGVETWRQPLERSLKTTEMNTKTRLSILQIVKQNVSFLQSLWTEGIRGFDSLQWNRTAAQDFSNRKYKEKCKKYCKIKKQHSRKAKFKKIVLHHLG